MYYIYHIKDFKWKDGSIGKIGCTEKPKERVKRQKYIDYDILETHTDIMIASQREIELQKQYGYKVDKVPYWKSKKAPTKEGRVKSGRKAVESGQLAKIQSLGGKIQGKTNAESGHWVRIIKLSAEKRKKPVLQFTKEGQFLKEWDSIANASRELKINRGNIISCCKGNRKSAGGYVWKYKS
jgi:hypothetical protein